MSWYTKNELKPFRNTWVESFQNYVSDFVGPQYETLALAVVGLGLLLLVFFLLDFIIKNILLYFTKKIVNLTSFEWDNHFYNNKVFNSVYHLIPLAFTRLLAPYVLYPLPNLLNATGKVFDIVFVVIMLQFMIRIASSILSISTDENNYRTIAVRTFSQLMKIITIFFAVLIVISILFNVKLNSILAGLGAATAILLLIFRDTILGFVSGIQIATTRMVKVGDWVSIGKYNLEGVVKEINLVSCKIENFDKTISSIPTYDLITTEVKNFEAMRGTNTRRIKRSIVFNVKSFKFVDDEMLEKYKRIDIIKNYISRKELEIEKFNREKAADITIPANGRRLTNIGVFRKYALSYLQENQHISKRDTLMVRQLEITPNGMPLEIYCFTKTVVWDEYESVQADIFDHLVTASREFDLDVVQTIPTA